MDLGIFGAVPPYVLLGGTGGIKVKYNNVKKGVASG